MSKFSKNILTLDAEMKEFFSKVGINDLNKSIEIIPYNTEKNGRVFNHSIYHICGEIINKRKQDKEISLAKEFNI